VNTLLHIDGSSGEGGGQLLRSALALSLVTGTPFRIDKIRAGRGKPGLLRQHLTSVNAAAAIGAAKVEGASLGSTALEFHPTGITPGEFHFDIGTAGATTLVLQAALPALARAKAPSSIVLTGGTHVPWSPPVEFVVQVLAPVLRSIGVHLEVELVRPGYYPAGGGELRVHVTPAASFAALELMERGPERARRLTAVVNHLSGRIAEREAATVRESIAFDDGDARVVVERRSPGPGNVVFAVFSFDSVTELVSAIGAKDTSAEQVAAEVVSEARAYLSHDAPVGEHLADQLIPWLAIAGRGRFRTAALSSHARTQLDVVKLFLGDVLRVEESERGVIVSARRDFRDPTARV